MAKIISYRILIIHEIPHSGHSGFISWNIKNSFCCSNDLWIMLPRWSCVLQSLQERTETKINSFEKLIIELILTSLKLPYCNQIVFKALDRIVSFHEFRDCSLMLFETQGVFHSSSRQTAKCSKFHQRE